jgi:hypothetical protein
MFTHPIRRFARTAALALSLLPAGTAFAALSIGTDLGGGSLQNVGYGSTGLASQVSPLLFVKELASTQPPVVQVSGTPLTYSASYSGAGTSVLDLTYTIANTSASASFTDLRFMLDTQPDGSPSFRDVVSESWGAKIAGDPDARQVQDLLPDLSNALLTSMAAGNGVIDGSNPCVGACDADFGLQWNHATLGPGESWTINVKLVDDPSLVIGGRYLMATSFDTAGTQLVFGNAQLVPEPQTFALLAAGLLMTVVATRRRLV